MLHRVIDSPVGELTLLVDETDALVAVYLADQAHGPDETGVDLGERSETAGEDAVRQLREYFAGERQTFDLRLEPRGTVFQRRVWEALRDIPYGSTATYGQVAERIGSPRATRAVGAATGRNPLGIVVPCHRLVGSSGGLTGYAGGLERKRWLLDFEAGGALI